MPSKTTLTEVGPGGKVFRRYTHQTGQEGWSLGWIARPLTLKILGLTTFVIVIPSTELAELRVSRAPQKLETGSIEPKTVKQRRKPREPENPIMQFFKNLDPFAPTPSRK